MVALLAPAAGAVAAGRRTVWRERLTGATVLPLTIFAATRVFDAGLIALLARGQRPRVANPGLMVVQPEPASFGYWDTLTNWDGQWYQRIAEHGYPTTLPTAHGAVTSSVWAFYPGYPALVRLTMGLTRLPFAYAASMVSLLCGALAVLLLYRMVLPLSGRYAAAMSVLAVGMAPAAPLLQAAYGESLALLLVVACLLLLQRRRYGALVLVTVALSLTRPVALPVAALIAVHGLARWLARRDEPFARRERWACVGAAAAGAVSFMVWPVVCAVVTGDPRAYLETQRAWWPSGTPGSSSWLGQAFADHGWVAVLLVLLALGALLGLLLRRSDRQGGLELGAWPPLYGLYILAATPPTPSVIRFALLAVVPWRRPPAQRAVPSTVARVAVVTAVVVGGAVLQVVWLRYLFTIRLGMWGNP